MRRKYYMRFSSYNIICNIDDKKYVYNSISKSVIQLQTDCKYDFENDHLSNVEDFFDNEQCFFLQKNGFIVENDLDEFRALEYIYKKNFFDSSDLTLILTPTFECNFACPYCFEVPQRGTKTSSIYFEALKKYADKNFKYYRHVELSLFGGEPLLLYDQFQDMLNYTKKLSEQYTFNYSTSIVTNGSLITESIVETLIKHHCQTFQITIDGGKESHNKTRKFKNNKSSFDILIKIINEKMEKYFLYSKSEFYLRINLNNNSVEEVKDALLHIREELRKYITVSIRAIYNTESYLGRNRNTVEELKEFYDMAASLGYKLSNNRYYNRSCEACCDEKVFYVTPDLGLWKCINTMSVSNGKIGFINENGDVTIDAKKMLDWYSAANCFSDRKCVKCRRLPDCFGGCILHKSVYGKRVCTPFDMTSLSYFYD